MSWDIDLIGEDGKPVIVDPFEEGGTYPVGGTDRAELNVTYNYSWFYYQFLDRKNGIKALDGQRAGDWIERLQTVVDTLPEGPKRPDYDYWADTPSNARKPLVRLLAWAKQYPDAVFSVR